MKIFFLLLMAPCLSYAGPYYEVVNSTTAGTSTMTISGYIGVAASSTTPTTYKFRIDGPNGYIQFPDGTTQTSASGGGAVLAATQTFTGGNTFLQSSTFTGTVNLPTRDKIILGNSLHNSSSTVLAQYNTTQTTFAAGCVTGSTLTITVSALSWVMVSLAATVYNNGVGNDIRLGVKADGSSINGELALIVPTMVASNYTQNGSFTYLITSVSAGAHSFCLDMKTNGNTATLANDGVNFTNQWSVTELR